MSQLRLPIKRDKSTVLSKRLQADSSNLQAAQIILENPRSEGLQREWANRVIAKIKQNQENCSG